MISREDIALFYKRYKANLDKGKELENLMFSTESEEEWIELVEKMQGELRQIYNDNEDMLDIYIRPYMFDEREFTEEEADEYIEQVAGLCLEGYNDYMAGILMAKKLSEYYKKINNIDQYIKALHFLGGFYSRKIDKESRLKGQRCFDIERRYISDYFSFKSWETRRRILLSWHNYCIMQIQVMASEFGDKMDEVEHQNRILETMNEGIEVYSNPDIIAFDGDKFEFDMMKEKLMYDVFGNYICSTQKEKVAKTEFLNVANTIIEEVFTEQLKEAQSIYNMGDEIVCSYLICKYLMDEISCLEFVERFYDYATYVLKNDEYDIRPGVEDTRYFHIFMNQLPVLMQFLQSAEITASMRNEISDFIIKSMLDNTEKIPHSCESERMDGIIQDTVVAVIPYLPQNISVYHFIYQMVINRNEKTVMHVNMVSRLSSLILKSMIMNSPKLLVGVLNTGSVDEVIYRQVEIEDFVRQASLIFDIGKAEYSPVVNVETRRLCIEEVEELIRHAQEGYELVKNINKLEPFFDIIRGHHKSYDGKSGYPADFDNTKSKNRIIIDLIKICDCMNAATDTIGRAYKTPLSYDEFIEELKSRSGTEYNPDIVNIIVNNKELNETLKKYIENERTHIYFNTYKDIIAKKTGKDEDNRLNNISVTDEIDNPLVRKVFASIIKAMIKAYEINLMDNTIKEIYLDRNKLVGEKHNFKDYLNYTLGKQVYKDDIQKLYFLFDVSALSNKMYLHNGMTELEIRAYIEGELKWIRLQILTTEEANGVLKKCTLMIQDIDKECKKREQIKQALELAKEQEREANEAKSMFLSNIAHEIRTPMNAINGMSEILLRRNKNNEIEKYLKNINSSGKALISIVNDILDFSKIESGYYEIVNEVYEPLRMISELEMIFLNRIGNKNIKLVLNIDENMPEYLYGDSLRIRQIIINIMNNAIKFTESGSVTLDIKVKNIENDIVTLKFEITDTGQGIKEEDIPLLFGEYTQMDTRRNRNKEGTGLGLAISKKLVELMGGTISVESTYGKGTTFHFSLTNKIADKMMNMASDTAGFIAPDAKILLVDDIDVNIMVMSKLIEPFKMRIDVAENGKEAVNKVMTSEYDIIFMDYLMPVMDGKSAVIRIRESDDERVKDIPVIAFTANAVSTARDELLRAGMNDFVALPADMSDISRVLRKWLRQELIYEKV